MARENRPKRTSTQFSKEPKNPTKVAKLQEIAEKIKEYQSMFGTIQDMQDLLEYTKIQIGAVYIEVQREISDKIFGNISLYKLKK